MAKVYVSIGSNIEKQRHIARAIQDLHANFGALQVSPIYQTAAIGFDGDDFHNLVVGFNTELTPTEVYTRLKDIEAQHGRIRGKEQFESRTLDLDQLLYDDLEMHTEEIQIPHQDIERYIFVLRPLADLAGEKLHPVLKKPLAQLWDELRAAKDDKMLDVSAAYDGLLQAVNCSRCDRHQRQ